MSIKGKIKRAIIVPDQHFPIHDESAFRVVLKAIEFIKPSIFINLGDVGEWETVSAWRYKRRRRPPIEYQLPLINKEISSCPTFYIEQFKNIFALILYLVFQFDI